MAALSDCYRVLARDLPAHGDTEGPFTLRRAVESVRVAIDEGGGRAYVVGISGGAVVALLTCLEHPTEVAGLVLSAGLAHPPRLFVVQRALTRHSRVGASARPGRDVLGWEGRA